MKLFRSHREFAFILFFILTFFSFIKSVKPPEVFAQRRVVGRIVNEATGNFFQPENDNGNPFSCGGAFETVAGAEGNDTLVVKNSGGSDSDWACNPDPFYNRRASSGGSGPHTFTLTPPSGYDCSEDVRWGIGYPLGYTPPGGAITSGDGCTANVYLGPDDWDNHLQWFLDNTLPPNCSITSAAECINDETQVKVTWNNMSDPDLVFDRFVVRGADSRFGWFCDTCVFRDMGAGNTGATSTIFNIGDGAGEIAAGIKYKYNVSINNGNIPDYQVTTLCSSNEEDVLLACQPPTPTPTPIPNKKPVCDFGTTPDPPDLLAGELISFTDLSKDVDGDIVARDWDFDNGNTATIKNPTQTYTKSGIYTVTLEVKDNDGATDSCDKEVIIEDPPEPPKTPILAYEGLCDEWRASIRLSWNAPGGATDYDLQKCTEPPCSPIDYETFGFIEDTTFLDKEVFRGDYYQYRIRAHDSENDLYSDYSSWLTVIAPACEFCGYTGGPVSDPDIGTIFTAIGCIPTKSPEKFVKFYLKWGMGVAGGTAMVLIVIAGFMIISAGGDAQRVKAGKELLGASIGGLFLFLLSTYLLRLIGIDILQIPGF